MIYLLVVLFVQPVSIASVLSEGRPAWGRERERERERERGREGGREGEREERRGLH